MKTETGTSCGALLTDMLSVLLFGAGDNVKVVESFMYIGVGSGKHDIRHTTLWTPKIAKCDIPLLPV